MITLKSLNNGNDVGQKLRRKRSNSLDIKSNKNVCTDNEIWKFSSNNNISENLSDSSNLLFVNWFKNRKSFKGTLSQLKELGILNNGFPKLENKFQQIMFLLSNLLKVENDYEIYTINRYDARLLDFIKWSKKEKKELFDEYNKGYNEINQKIIEISSPHYDEGDNKVPEDGMEKFRRYSETMGLMLFNKNHQISTFLPNKSSTSYDVISKISEVNIIDQSRRQDKSLKHVIVSKDAILIFANKKTERLKYKFLLKHLYCETCNDSQIQNIDSTLRIGGPFGDDLILTFNDPSSKIEWHNEIKNSISVNWQSYNLQTSDITIWKNLELNSSAPLDSKIFNINYKTTGLEMKKKAIEGFNQSDKCVGDFILTFNLTGINRENVLHDDVIVMALQEHIGCFGEVNSCSDVCKNFGNKILLNRTHFYLRYNPLKETSKVKKLKMNFENKTLKTKSYLLDERWSDNTVPEWLLILLSDLYYEGSQSEGIFRKSSVKSKSDDIINMICEGADDIEIKEEIHTKANILKKFLFVIDGSIFTSSNKEKLIALGYEIISFTDFIKNGEQINKVLNIIQNLPFNNYNLLQMLLLLFDQICKNDTINKMTLSNLSASLAPSVLTEMNKSTTEDFLRINSLFECMLSLVDRIVDESSKKTIISLFDKRKSFTESIGIHSAEKDSNKCNHDMSLELGSTGSKLDVKKRSVREKIEVIDKLNFRDSDPTLSNHSLKKSVFKDMRNSYSEESTTDKVDGTFKPLISKLDISNNLLNKNSKSRYKQNKLIFPKSHQQVESKENTKSPESITSSPFRRQPQVNRKHRDHSLTNCKVTMEEQKCIDLTKEISKDNEQSCDQNILRNIEKTVCDKPYSSRDRINLSKSDLKPTQLNEVFTFYSHYNEESGDENQTVQPTERELGNNTNESKTKANKITRNNNFVTKNTNMIKHTERPFPGDDGTSDIQISLPHKSSELQRNQTMEENLKDEIKSFEDCDK